MKKLFCKEPSFTQGRSRWSVGVLSCLALAMTIAVTPAARADSYGFTFSGGGFSGSGVITTSDTVATGVPGAEQVTGISGTFSDAAASIFNAAITGLQAPPGLTSTPLPSINADGTFVPPGTSTSGFSFDDLFYPVGNSPAVCPPPGPGDPNPAFPYGGGTLDIYGILFDVQGGYNVDLWSNGVIPGFGLTYGIGVGDSANESVVNTFGEPFSGQSLDLNVTPEPASLLLLGTGLLGLAGPLLRKFKFKA